MLNERPWWPSGLICNVSNSIKDRWLGLRFKPHLGLQYWSLRVWNNLLLSKRKVTRNSEDGWIKKLKFLLSLLSLLWILFQNKTVFHPSGNYNTCFGLVSGLWDRTVSTENDIYENIFEISPKNNRHYILWIYGTESKNNKQ